MYICARVLALSLYYVNVTNILVLRGRVLVLIEIVHGHCSFFHLSVSNNNIKLNSGDSEDSAQT